ncbi:nitrogen fixation protein NifX [Sulfuricurvum kujiense DSM 16994]|uniref:Nitrogen fixation protein NifX n=1 Tax=Sulfuricurvum kujiense (strain ATCC BAA-921 / DSM 16994 / JCM 11577 / YK-1) TaxID=709032 RepID=E4TY41_SULKY|nr:nitrogen fixation protein NifX [Sulfuricurvum kujiense]ADR33961.1 nitrogen fixation protein NifX [Sulfuricurvum kujiense DSM 16994]
MNTKITVEGNGTMNSALKVAFATKDMEEINAHFGGAKEFVVYNVSKDGYEVSEVIKTDNAELEDDDKTDYRVRALKGVNIMYSESIGGTAAAKVIRAGIHPMKANNSTRIEEVLKELVKMINGNPPPWIKNIMQMQTEHDVRQDRWAEGE